MVEEGLERRELGCRFKEDLEVGWVEEDLEYIWLRRALSRLG